MSELVGAEIEMYDDERIAAFLAEDALTPDTALRLERVTGASAAFWLGLQQDWDLWHAERGDAARAIAVLAPLAVAQGREAVVDPDS